MTLDQEIKVKVEKISLKGPGVLILTGPSSCGKGEVANVLSKVMSLPANAHLSMGEILRTTFHLSKTDPQYARMLASRYQISHEANIYSCIDTTEELTKKVLNNRDGLAKHFNRTNVDQFISQLEWLEFCTLYGLLVPNRWTQNFLEVHLEQSAQFKTEPFILDGYPRTVQAAKHLIETLRNLNIPVIKVLHLSISRQEMLSRALQRGREDDDEHSLVRRYQFYTESVQPSVDYLKIELGSQSIALIDAHQPVFLPRENPNLSPVLDLNKSILNVVASAMRSLGIPRIIVRDILEI